MVELITENQREPLPDTCSKDLRDLVDNMLKLKIEERIDAKQIIDILFIIKQRLVLDKNYLEK